MDMLNTFALYTVIAVWCLGGIVTILLLARAALWVAWRIYQEIHGWRTIFKAVRRYEEQRRAERHARNVAAMRYSGKKDL